MRVGTVFGSVWGGSVWVRVDTVLNCVWIDVCLGDECV